MTLICFIALAVTPLNLFPVPEDISFYSNNTFSLLSGMPIVVADDASEEELAGLRAAYPGAGTEFPFVKASAHSTDKAAIYVGEFGRHDSFTRKRMRRLLGDTRPVAQGYHLVITERMAVIEGADAVGSRYGLETLAQIAKTGREVPCVEIVDGPDMAVRGLHTERMLTAEQLRSLAGLRCNLVVFRSADFYDLTDDRARQWRAVFAEARRLGIEPVPMLDIYGDAAPLIAKAPAVAEGMTRKDRLVLRGVEARTLSRPEILHTAAVPVEVRVSGMLCAEGEDYRLTEGADTWSIMRLDGGAIPEGATVEITYNHVPPETRAICPKAAALPELLEAVFTQLGASLEPKYLHLGQGPLDALNRDLRCRNSGKSNGELYVEAVAMASEIARRVLPGIEVILQADGLAPVHGAAWRGLADVAKALPADIILVASAKGLGGKECTALTAWIEGQEQDFFGLPTHDALDVYRWCEGLAAGGKGGRGFILESSPAFNASGTSLRLAMQKGWNTRGARSVWPQGLNAYFGVGLWEPLFDEAEQAMVAHLNRVSLQGVAPEDEYKRFQAMLEALRQALPATDADGAMMDQLYRQLTTFVELETSFGPSRDVALLRKLVDLVKTYGAINPDVSEGRTNKIVSTIESKRLFVPSSILFGHHLLPCGESAVAGGEVIEVLRQPVADEGEHLIEATYDFVGCPGPVCRLDFETVGTATFTVSRSVGYGFDEVQRWTTQQRGGVRGPALLTSPFEARYMLVSVHAPAERAALRNLRVFASKASAQAVCPTVEIPPILDGRLQDAAWPLRAQVKGFVRLTERVFADEQTVIRLCRTADTLYIGAEMFDAEPASMKTGAALRDGALWLEESLEILIDAGKAMPYRLALTPLCVQYDSRGTDVSWDATWRVTTRRHDTGWTAEIAIPFAALDEAKPEEAAWGFNFIRNRRNVSNETSAWTSRDGPSRQPENFGKITF